MKYLDHFFKKLICIIIACTACSSYALDLPEIKSKGELRHLGIRYANFVTGAGDGLDVEIMKGFAREIGVNYQLVYSDFSTIVRDLLGKNVSLSAGTVELTGNYPILGDVIAAGFTVLPWREQILLFSEPTFPSQVVLIARAHSAVQPISGSKNIEADIKQTKALIGSNSLLVMEKTCLDPGNYGLRDQGYDIRPYVKSTNINEMVPALLNEDADLSLLDVPDLMIDINKWAGKFKVLGPISDDQVLATAFPKDAPLLREAFNLYLQKIKSNGTYGQLIDKYYPGIRKYFPKFFEAY